MLDEDYSRVVPSHQTVWRHIIMVMIIINIIMVMLSLCWFISDDDDEWCLVCEAGCEEAGDNVCSDTGHCTVLSLFADQSWSELLQFSFVIRERKQSAAVSSVVEYWLNKLMTKSLNQQRALYWSEPSIWWCPMDHVLSGHYLLRHCSHHSLCIKTRLFSQITTVVYRCSHR